MLINFSDSSAKTLKLNDCGPAVNWTVAVAKSADAAGEAKFTPALANKADCLALTPSFETLGK